MEIVYAIIGSGALSALISGLFGYFQAKKSKQDEITEKLDEIMAAQAIAEKDALRTQLLVMITEFPQEQSDILRLAQHYFETLHGNWVLTDIFLHWCDEYQISLPAWARDEQK